MSFDPMSFDPMSVNPITSGSYNPPAPLTPSFVCKNINTCFQTYAMYLWKNRYSDNNTFIMYNKCLHDELIQKCLEDKM